MCPRTILCISTLRIFNSAFESIAWDLASVEAHLDLTISAATSINWSPGLTVSDNGSLITDARPLETTTYTLTVADQFGCENTDELVVSVDNDFKLLISNVLTPNGDGRNDTWRIENSDAFDVLHIKVYDRWGKPVYEADNYSQAWDGNVNLDALPEGTYFYLITFDDSDRVYKGSVSILREQN